VAPRILSGPAWTGGTLPLALTGLLEEDGALFLRYRAVRSRAAGDEPLPLG
jgi:hypothetical protein